MVPRVEKATKVTKPPLHTPIYLEVRSQKTQGRKPPLAKSLVQLSWEPLTGRNDTDVLSNFYNVQPCAHG